MTENMPKTSKTWFLGQRVRVRAQVVGVNVDAQAGLGSVYGTPIRVPDGLPLVNDHLRDFYHTHNWRVVLRRPMPPENLVALPTGIIVGWSVRFCGERWWEDEVGWTSQNGKGVRVWRVAVTERWREPLDVLPEDLEAVESF